MSQGETRPPGLRASLLWTLMTRQKAVLSRLGFTLFIQFQAAYYVGLFTRDLVDRVVVAQATTPDVYVTRVLTWAVILGVASFFSAQMLARMTGRMEHDLRLWCFTRLQHVDGLDATTRRELVGRIDDAGVSVLDVARTIRPVLLLAPVTLGPLFAAAKPAPVLVLVVVAMVVAAGFALAKFGDAGPAVAAVAAAGQLLLVVLVTHLLGGAHIWPVHTPVTTGTLFVVLQCGLAALVLCRALARTGTALAGLDRGQRTILEVLAAARAPRSWGAAVPGTGTLDVRDLVVGSAARPLDLSAGPGELVVVQVTDRHTRSELARALAGTVPPMTGNVELGGVPVDALDPTEHRVAVRLIGEESLFVAGSVRENLTLGMPGAVDDARLAAALGAVGLSIPVEMWDEPVDDFEAAFSAAERQRLAVARALVGALRLLVLDEGLSALDDGQVLHVLAAVRADAPGAAIVYVTGRQAATEAAHQVVAVDSAPPAADGTAVTITSVPGVVPRQGRSGVAAVLGAVLALWPVAAALVLGAALGDQATGARWWALSAGALAVAAAWVSRRFGELRPAPVTRVFPLVLAVVTLLALQPSSASPLLVIGGLLLAVFAFLALGRRPARAWDRRESAALAQRFARDVADADVATSGKLEEEVRLRFADDSWELHRTRWLGDVVDSAWFAVVHVAATTLPAVVLAALARRAFHTDVPAADLLLAGMVATALATLARDLAATARPVTRGREAETAATADGGGTSLARTITFDHVSFRYPGSSRPVLEDVTFTASSGEVIAVAGLHGSGKSTLLRLAAGTLTPTEGTVRVEGPAGARVVVRDDHAPAPELLAEIRADAADGGIVLVATRAETIARAADRVLYLTGADAGEEPRALTVSPGAIDELALWPALGRGVRGR